MILKLLGLLLVAGLVVGQADSQLSCIADQIDQYCDLRRGCGGSSQPTQNIAAPRVGKAGPRGRPGAPGPAKEGPPGAPGPATEVDYPRIESSMDEKLRVIREEMAQMRETYEQRGREIREEMAQMKIRENKRLGLCKVEYQGKCFWAIKRVVNGAQGIEICKAEGGKAANLYDNTHFEMLRKYLVTLFGNGHGVYTGMNYRPQTGITTLENGTRSSFTKWQSAFPQSYSAYTAIMFHVRSDPNDQYSGMLNHPPSETYYGVLCEI